MIETQNHKLYDGEITESKLLSKKLQKRKSRKPRLSEPKPFNDFLYKNAKMGLFWKYGLAQRKKNLIIFGINQKVWKSGLIITYWSIPTAIKLFQIGLELILEFIFSPFLFWIPSLLLKEVGTSLGTHVIINKVQTNRTISNIWNNILFYFVAGRTFSLIMLYEMNH